jgi:hypothetical protein
VLLSHEEDGHTAYLRRSKCLDDKIKNYIVEGLVPRKNLVCPATIK